MYVCICVGDKFSLTSGVYNEALGKSFMLSARNPGSMVATIAFARNSKDSEFI